MPGRFVKAMIVEDHALFRQVFRGALESTLPGVSVIEAEDLTEAFRLLKEHRPDVVFLDLHLPDGNGLELATFLRRELPGCALGICCSHDSPEYREAARECGALFFDKGQIDAAQVARFAVEAMERASVSPWKRGRTS